MKEQKLPCQPMNILRKITTKNKGFTIIELIVVIAVIAVLSGIITSSVFQYLVKSRDSKRVADLNQIKKILEMYRADNGNYPILESWGTYNTCNWVRSTDPEWAELESLLAPYSGSLPIDPTNRVGWPWNGDPVYVYGCVAGGDSSPKFNLLTSLEDTSNPLRNELNCYKWLFGQVTWCSNCGGGGNCKQIYDAGYQN